MSSLLNCTNYDTVFTAIEFQHDVICSMSKLLVLSFWLVSHVLEHLVRSDLM